MKRLLRWLFGITACKLIELKEGECLLVTPARPISQQDAVRIRDVFQQHLGKRVIVGDPSFEVTVIRPPGD
jgi:hypothetical protein